MESNQMIDLNERVAKESLSKKTLSDKQQFSIVLELLKNLIKYRANNVN
jgi:hypothetical protein